MSFLLGFEFRQLSCQLAYNFMQGIKTHKQDEIESVVAVSPSILQPHITLFDLRRLSSYAKNLVDFHLILDLVPAIARLYFSSTLPTGSYNLSPV